MVHTSGREDAHKPNPGFQGSETTGAEVIIYPQGGDPITVSSTPVKFTGRRASDDQPSLVSVTMNKILGAGSGDWSFTCKPGRSSVARSLFTEVVDDDWVDIVLTRHGRRWHVMRGLMNRLQRPRSVSGSGSTSTSFTFTGKDFGKIWESTNIWFNPYSAENLGGAISQKVFTAMENNLGSPSKAVLSFLKDMLREIGLLGRGSWVLPRSLPQRGIGSFIQAVDFDTSGYPAALDNTLEGLSQNWLLNQGNVWQLAKEWSDPLFNELYCDIFPGVLSFDPNNEVLPSDSRLTLVFRERPFPTVLMGKSSPWFKLPLNIIPREQLTNDDVGRGGAERYNAYFVSPQITQELLKQSAIDMLEPLWDSGDISRHGFRRFDVMSKYTDKSANLLTLASQFREKVRDWYCLNPYLLNGSINLGVMRPEIKIGTRARIPGARSPDEDETYYVEQVTHSWQFGEGGRTSLGVTRGFMGQDDALLGTLRDLASRYSTPQRARPGIVPDLDGIAIV